MSLDLADIERGLREMEAFYRQRAARGLRAGAADMQATMRATTVYNDDTGATRAGTVAYVVGDGDSGASVLAEAVDAVEDKNPGSSATAPVTIDGDLGVVATIPTDYQEELEFANQGDRAVLGPALDLFADTLTARAARGR